MFVSQLTQSEIFTVCPFQAEFTEPCSHIETIFKGKKGILTIILCLNFCFRFFFKSETFMISFDVN